MDIVTKQIILLYRRYRVKTCRDLLDDTWYLNDDILWVHQEAILIFSFNRRRNMMYINFIKEIFSRILKDHNQPYPRGLENIPPGLHEQYYKIFTYLSVKDKSHQLDYEIFAGRMIYGKKKIWNKFCQYIRKHILDYEPHIDALYEKYLPNHILSHNTIYHLTDDWGRIWPQIKDLFQPGTIIIDYG